MLCTPNKVEWENEQVQDRRGEYVIRDATSESNIEEEDMNTASQLPLLGWRVQGQGRGTRRCDPDPVLPPPGVPVRPPRPSEFGVVIVETTNSYPASTDSARISDPHCVQASAGHYMCPTR